MEACTLSTRALVLYVEDEPHDVLFMTMAFEKAGLIGLLRPVGDGHEAIDYLAGKGAYADRRQHPLPVLILLDLNLPVVSGFDVLEWMAGRSELKALPVVVFSSSPREEDKLKARELGAMDFIEKPSSTVGLEAVVLGLKERWLSGAMASRR